MVSGNKAIIAMLISFKFKKIKNGVSCKSFDLSTKRCSDVIGVIALYAHMSR